MVCLHVMQNAHSQKRLVFCCMLLELRKLRKRKLQDIIQPRLLGTDTSPIETRMSRT